MPKIKSMLPILTLFGALVFSAAAKTDAFARLSQAPGDKWNLTRSSIQFEVAAIANPIPSTIEGYTNQLQGFAFLEPDSLKIISASAFAPLSEINTGTPAVNCRLKEALGLDYETSDYPEKHVCAWNDTLPDSGPNAVKFPEIRFELLAIQKKVEDLIDPDWRPQWIDGEIEYLTLKGRWTLHGVTLDQSLPVRIVYRVNGGDSFLNFKKNSSLLADLPKPTVYISGETYLNLSAFQVEVIPYFLMEVHDEVRVKFSLEFSPIFDGRSLE